MEPCSLINYCCISHSLVLQQASFFFESRPLIENAVLFVGICMVEAMLIYHYIVFEGVLQFAGMH